ncbi:MAG TPA: hypothetical protein PKY82_09635 [Pyrinomonadaceae bacterium]|nr:hypothetical protein [Pyrinomonadaceae bacterium]
MLKVIKCPSCAAPLECDGDAFEKCVFCGSQIAVTPDNSFSENAVGFDGMLKNAHKLKEVLRLVRGGNKIEAIKLYRETFHCSLSEAKNAVDRLESGQSVSFQNVRFQTANVVSPEAAKTALKAVGIFSGSMLLISAVIVISVLAIIGGVLWTIKTKVADVTRIKTPVLTPTKTNENVKPAFARELLRFGGEGVGAGNFKDNRVIAVDGEGKIYSADYSDGRIQVFDKDGKFLTQWFLEKKDRAIYALTASRKGTVYVAQSSETTAYEGTSGKLLNKVNTNFVSDLAVTVEGKVIAVDRDSILIFDENLKNLATFKDIAKTAGVTGSFRCLTVNGLGEIYAIAGSSKDVCKFSADGKFVDRFKVKSTTPTDIAVDAKGRIFISEVSKVWVYQPDGNLLDSFDTTQTFAITFNDQGELITASRPFVVKYALNQ